MQRYFIPPENMRGQTAILQGGDAHHLARVMRAAVGDKVVVNNGAGRECVAEITELAKDCVSLRLIEDRPISLEPKAVVWLAQSLPKGDKLESVIQKGTEIGVSAFQPFVSARTIVHYDARKEANRMERWRKIAKEAAEQSHRGIVPEVRETLTWKQLLLAAEDANLVLFCYEKHDALPLREALQAAKIRSVRGPILIVIGPEGGFTEEEAEEAQRSGFTVVGLGARILRTETAGLVAASCIFYETGEMGG